MPAARFVPLVDTLEQKLKIERKLGRAKSRKYFNLLSRFFTLKISKPKFDKLCIDIIERENLHLHNDLILSIFKKACLSKLPPTRKGNADGSLSIKIPNVCQKSDLQPLCRDLPQSPRKVRTPNLRDRRFKDRPSTLVSHGKNHSIVFEDSALKIHEQQSTVDIYSVGSMPPLSAEDGEEVNQVSDSPINWDRSLIGEPLGIPTYTKEARKLSFDMSESEYAYVTSTCQHTGHLPDTSSLMKKLEQKLDREGFKVSADSANLLNKALDVYLKRLIKPCLDYVVSKPLGKVNGPIQPGLNELSSSRYVQKPSVPGVASISDFWTAMELNPVILGKDWPSYLERRMS